MRTVMNKEVAIFVSLLREWCSKSNYVHSFYQILDGKTIHHICIHTHAISTRAWISDLAKRKLPAQEKGCVKQLLAKSNSV